MRTVTLPTETAVLYGGNVEVHSASGSLFTFPKASQLAYVQCVMYTVRGLGTVCFGSSHEITWNGCINDE